MNIFILDSDPKVSAQNLCDKHVVKMLLESAQMLCVPFHLQTIEIPLYKLTHSNHPCNVWIRQSRENYEWLLEHAIELGSEYTYRFDKIHKSSAVVTWCLNKFSMLDFPFIKQTDFVQAMPEIYKSNDAVTAYRSYYKGEKSRFAKWNRKRQPPKWWKVDK